MTTTAMNIADVLDTSILSGMLDAARARTLRYAAVLKGEQWLGPYLPIVNPPQWEIGHLGWFQEHWCLRHSSNGGLSASMLDGADALYDSAKVAHATRWSLPLPTVDETLGYLERVLDVVKARLKREGATPHLRYFVQLAVFHEDMHNEAFDYSLQTHGYAASASMRKYEYAEPPVTGDAAISGGRFQLGAQADQGDQGFVFDNEKWAHDVEVQPFHMSRTAATNEQFAAFVRDGGYSRRELWCEPGWQWLSEHNVTAPLYWKVELNQILTKVHQAWLPLQAQASVIHVNWYEAEAYCRWAQRRQPQNGA